MMGAAGQSKAQVLPKADLNDYVGKYKMTGLPFPYIEVSIQDGKLNMKAGEQAGRGDPNERSGSI